MIGVLLWALGCGEPDLREPTALPEASVDLQVVSRRVGSGEAVSLVERLEWESGWTAPETTIGVEGLEVALVSAEEGEEQGRQWREARYLLTGEDGSYFLPAGVLVFNGPAGESRQVNTPAIDVDIGVQGPTSDLEAMGVIPAQDETSWRAWGGLLVGLLMLLAGALWFWKRKREGPLVEVPLSPPDEEALAAWRLAQEDLGLDDHERALELSRIFRRYLERVMAPFPATRWTQREILEALESQGGLDGETLGRCRTLLAATDALKFARRGGGADFFDGLDLDLKQVIQQTRPVSEPSDLEEGASA